MAIKELLIEAQAIQVGVREKDWQKVIEMAARPLVENGYILPSYHQAVIANTLEHGAYYVFEEGIAMPHARPECGALKTGLSLTLLKSPVVFDEGNQPVSLLIGLSATDSTSHIDAIQALSELLCEEENIASLLAATSEKQLAEILARA